MPVVETKSKSAEKATTEQVAPTLSDSQTAPTPLVGDLVNASVKPTAPELSALGGASSEVVEPTVSMPVLNPKTQRYEIQEVPESRALTITAGMMKESWEGAGGQALSTDGYNPAFHYCWVTKDRSNPTTNEALQKSYRAHTPERSVADARGHAIENVPGWGECVTFGDLILTAVPKAQAIARQEAYNAQRRQERAQMLTAGRDHIQNTLDDRVQVHDHKSRIMEEHTRANFEHEELDFDRNRAEMAAASLAQARNYDEYVQESGGRTSFGGFQGRPGFNSAIPESPMVRRLMELQAGLSK